MVADPATFRVLPWARQHRLDAVRHLFSERQAGAVLDARALSRRAGEAREGRASTISPGSRSNSSCSSSIDPKLAPGRSDLAARGAGGRAHHARLSVSHRVALRPGRADPRSPAPDHAGARHAAALARGRAWARASTSSPSRRRRGLAAGRHHGAVPQRREAGGAAARLSASASCAGRACPTPSPAAGICISRCSTAKPGRTRSSRMMRSELLSPLGRHFLAGLLAHARAGRGLRDADGQRLQALSRRQLDGADPGDLGATTIAA